MTKLFKGQRKGLVAIVIGLFVTANLALPLAGPAFAADFNEGSQPYELLSGTTVNGSTNWKTSFDIEIGEGFSLLVYLKNTSDEEATDVEVEIDFDIDSDGEGAEAEVTVTSDNAPTMTDTVRMDLDGGGEIAGFEYTESVVRDKDGDYISVSDQDDVFSGGVNIGDIDEDEIRYFIIDLYADGVENGGGEDEPDVQTLSATDIEEDSATLRCEVDANGDDTDVWFEWGEDWDDLDEDTDEETVDEDESNERVEIEIDDLDEDTKYYFRCIGRNSEGTDRGLIRSFTTDENGGSDGRPEATTLSADRIEEDRARLRCDVDTNGDDAEAWFEWGEKKNDLDEETDSTDVNDDETNERVTETIKSLDEDTKYYFRCIVEDDGGERDRGSIKSFTTDDNGRRSGRDPEVVTLSPTGVTQTSATLRGEVDPNDEDTEAWFEWGTSISRLTGDTSREDVGDGDRDVRYDYSLRGLSGNTTYYYRAIAENDEGTDRGVIRSFRTGSPVVNVVTRVVEVFREVEEEPEVEALIITLDADRTGAEDSREIEYIVSYDNRTDETFTDAVLVVDLPRELDFNDADPNPDDERGDNLIFEIGTITPGEQDSFAIQTEVDREVDEDEEIRFVADVEYTDDDTRKIVTVIDEHTFAEIFGGRAGGTFTALLIDSLRDFFTSPILWLILLALLVYFAVRYFIAGRDKRSAALV